MSDENEYIIDRTYSSRNGPNTGSCASSGSQFYFTPLHI